MTSVSLLEKIACSLARVDSKMIKKGNLSGEDFQKILVASKRLEQARIIFDDSSRLNIHTIGSRIKGMQQTFGVKIVFIDYLQLIAPANPKVSKYEQITEISQQLKILARECHIPIVCLAQLNRQAAGDSQPKISDLRDSGAIEQDADEIFLLHCPSLEDPYNKPGVLQVLVGKNRFGETGKLELAFEKSTGFIGNLSDLTIGPISDAFKHFSN